METLPPGDNRADRFILIRTNQGVHILAGEYGGYGGSDTWRLSTPVVKMLAKTCEEWLVETKSGSTYTLFRGSYGFSGLTMSVYNNFKERADQEDRTFDYLEPEEAEIFFDEELRDECGKD